jgi:hypothetical protein
MLIFVVSLFVWKLCVHTVRGEIEGETADGHFTTSCSEGCDEGQEKAWWEVVKLTRICTEDWVKKMGNTSEGHHQYFFGSLCGKTIYLAKWSTIPENKMIYI